MSSIDELLALPPQRNTKDHIVSELWPRASHVRPSSSSSFCTYWDYYAKRCCHALHDGGRHISVRTHRDILDIVDHLNGGHLRNHIRAFLHEKLSNSALSNEDEILDSSIDLAASLLLMIDFGGLQYGFSGHTQLTWDKGNLSQFLGQYFMESPVLGDEGVKLERIFTARNLERIAGMSIVWTDNLVDHLRLTEDDTKVSIFHHASFLEVQRSNSIFPDGLINETLRTLALLFPDYPAGTDADIPKWYSKRPSSLKLDRRVAQCRHLKTEDRQIERFRFWHDRLVTLKQVFDEAQPKSISQWWYDRRNRNIVQWYTFWVALLVLGFTLFFGLIQCIEGALQIYMAYSALPPQHGHNT